MAKTRKLIQEMIKAVDLIVELRDARIPGSGENPMFGELKNQRPILLVLNKADLADPDTTELWLNHYEKESGIRPLSLSANKKNKKMIPPTNKK